MGWIVGFLGIGVAVMAIRRFLRARYLEIFGSEEPEYRDPPVAPDLGWPGGRI